jgi:alpha-tubulin suppressor-like RCC1 family protein
MTHDMERNLVALVAPFLVAFGPACGENCARSFDLNRTGSSKQICLGCNHACSLQESGKIVCWGHGEHGALGDGRFASSKTAVEVAGISDATQIACGCGHTCALQKSGKVSCWGEGGSLGDGTEQDRGEPVEVRSIANATVIASEFAVAGSNLYVWGRKHLTPVQAGWYSDKLGIASIEAVVEASVLDAHGACVAMQDASGQSVECGETGTNFCGIEVFAPTKDVSTQIRLLSSGEDNACALDNSGKVWCWTGGRVGCLGYTKVGCTRSDLHSPERITGLIAIPGLADAVDISTAGEMACAVRAGGEVTCWGAEWGYGLGRPPSQSDCVSPPGSKVEQLSDAVQVSCYYYLSDSSSGCCARRKSGAVACWGTISDILDGEDSGSNVFSPSEECKYRVRDVEGV